MALYKIQTRNNFISHIRYFLFRHFETDYLLVRGIWKPARSSHQDKIEGINITAKPEDWVSICAANYWFAGSSLKNEQGDLLVFCNVSEEGLTLLKALKVPLQQMGIIKVFLRSFLLLSLLLPFLPRAIVFVFFGKALPARRICRNGMTGGNFLLKDLYSTQ